MSDRNAFRLHRAILYNVTARARKLLASGSQLLSVSVLVIHYQCIERKQLAAHDRKCQKYLALDVQNNQVNYDCLLRFFSILQIGETTSCPK